MSYRKRTDTSGRHARAEDHAEKHVPSHPLVHSLNDSSIEFSFAQSRDETQQHSKSEELLSLHCQLVTGIGRQAYLAETEEPGDSSCQRPMKEDVGP